MFFVLSPGRSGSRSIAQVLNQSPTCTCVHEPPPQFVRESVEYRHRERSAEELVTALRATRPQPSDGFIYGESSNRLALMIPPLVEAFPEAHFVWLIRDGRDFVCSALQRGWYGSGRREKELDWGRRIQGDRVGDVAPAVWSAMGPFEKICWFWAFMQRLIESDLERLAPARTMRVHIESLMRQIDNLCGFIGIQPTNFAIVRDNERIMYKDLEKVPVWDKRNVVNQILTWQDWPQRERTNFERWCGQEMDRLYPGWRDETGVWQKILMDLPRRNRNNSIWIGKEPLLIEKYVRLMEENARLELHKSSRELKLKSAQRRIESLERKHEDLKIRLEKAKKGRSKAQAELTQLKRSLTYRLARTLALVSRRPIRCAHILLCGIREKRRLTSLNLTHFLRLLEKLEGAASPGCAHPISHGFYSDALRANPMRILIIVVGMNAEDIERIVEQVAKNHKTQRYFEPVFVTDLWVFQIFLRKGFLFEYIPPADDWRKACGEGDWSHYFSVRIASIIRAYAPNRIIVSSSLYMNEEIWTSLISCFGFAASTDTAKERDGREGY